MIRAPADMTRRKALERISELRLLDAVAVARRLKLDGVPPSWPELRDPRGTGRAEIERLIAKERSRPDHPANWHDRAVEAALDQPRARTMYFLIRRTLWSSSEFLSLSGKARQILEIVVELAREEAFPWFVNVQAREVMRLARLNHASMAMRLRELECFAIARPARRIRLCATPGALPAWPSADNGWGVDPDVPLTDIAQWVVLYRRGIPGNASRAAWWLNYDLLCGTERVLPCFEVGLDTLATPYGARNQPPAQRAGVQDDDAFAAMQRLMTKRGPIPPPGLRAALWNGMAFPDG